MSGETIIKHYNSTRHSLIIISTNNNRILIITFNKVVIEIHCTRLHIIRIHIKRQNQKIIKLYLQKDIIKIMNRIKFKITQVNQIMIQIN